jgi:hypothetical protein
MRLLAQFVDVLLLVGFVGASHRRELPQCRGVELDASVAVTLACRSSALLATC